MTVATEAPQQTQVERVTPQPGSVRALLLAPAIQKRFEKVLGDPHRAEMFVTSLSTLVYASPQLRACDPDTVIAAALRAAAFDLPIEPSLGFACIIPYGKAATFQPGWKAFVQMAHRTGEYAKLNVTELYAGEYRGENRLTGDLILGERTGDEITGYAAYFRLVRGFEKSLYWTVEKIRAHGEHYSPGYKRQDSKWKTDFDSMARKTVIKQLLSKWGPLTTDRRFRELLAADAPLPGETAEPLSDEAKARLRAALYGEADPVDEPAQPQAEPPAAAEPAPAPVEASATQPPLTNAQLDAQIVAQDEARARTRRRQGS